MPVLLALLSSLLWGTSDFLGGTAARRLHALVVVGVSQGLALVLLVPFALTLGQHPDHLWAGPVAGVAGLIGLGAFYAALAAGTMGVIAPIAAAGAVVPVVVGLARGETPSALQLAGIAVALGGVILASGPELSGGAPVRPLLLAVVSAVAFGSVAVLVAEGSKGGSGSIVVTLLVMRGSSVGLLVALWLVRRSSRELVESDLPLLAAVGVGDLGANAAFAIASRAGLLSVVAVLASLYPVVTVLLARQVHDERLRPIQVAGVVGTLGGVALLAAG
ncbi:MAG: EamA family transporter [Mycobacteriales bacterium]